ncbi:hypothetical protein BJX70DRAFT_378346 [Aspergillus crustosus]
MLKLSQTLAVTLTMALAGVTVAKDCNTLAGGVLECVQYGKGSCNNEVGPVTQYAPTCGGNCYVDDFDYIFVSGNGVFGTDCIAYSDTECQNEIGRSGNQVVKECLDIYDDAGYPVGGGKSMKCYYNC